MEEEELEQQKEREEKRGKGRVGRERERKVEETNETNTQVSKDTLLLEYTPVYSSGSVPLTQHRGLSG